MSCAHAFVEAVVAASQFEKGVDYFSSRLKAHPCDIGVADDAHVHKSSANLLRLARDFLSGIDLLSARQAFLFQYRFDLLAGDVTDGVDRHSRFKEYRLYAFAARNSEQTIVALASNITNQIRDELLAETSVHVRSYN